jgi:hypothetical protein
MPVLAQEGWITMLPDLWRARAARRVAVDVIRPFVEQSRARLGSMPEAAWYDPYVVGFLGMLITALARHSQSRLRSQGLGLVQSDVWSDITGLPSDMIGQEMCMLDASRNARFEEGRGNAMAFFDVLRRGLLEQGVDVADAAASGVVAEFSPVAVLARDTAADSWATYFDDHLRLP